MAVRPSARFRSKATEKSINTAFVDLIDQMDDGPGKTLDAANEAGIPTPASPTSSTATVLSCTPLGYCAGRRRSTWPTPTPRSPPAARRPTGTSSRRSATRRRRPCTSTRSRPSRRSTRTSPPTPSRRCGRRPPAAPAPTAARLPHRRQDRHGDRRRGSDDQHVSSSWFAGFTPKLATAVMYNRGKGNEELEGYLIPFFGGTYPGDDVQGLT